ncbi:MAG TPA: aldo/keto reductase [Anaerolineales bacterium]|nr:aldo/keto reductase [Anaerolineales bacterium]
MQTYRLGTSDLNVSRIGYGAMSIGGSWDDTPLTDSVRKAALQVLHTALDAGINFFDHADIYCNGKSEEAFAELWKEAPHLRQQIYLQTKCGIRFGPPHRFDFSYEHIIASVEGSLKRLRTDYIDVLLLHRPDPLVEPEEVARAFDELKSAGKVRWFGVSNHTAAQMDLLRKVLNQPLVANQVEFNPIHTHMLDEGILFNQYNARLTRNEGAIEYCRLHNITLQAWAPLATGKLTGRPRPNDGAHIQKAADLVSQMAAEKGVHPEAILIAWILRHPARIQPLPGTTNPERLLAAIEADHIHLTREEWYGLFLAGRGEALP